MAILLKSFGFLAPKYFKIIWRSSILTLNVSGEGYFRKALPAPLPLNIYVYMFIFNNITLIVHLFAFNLWTVFVAIYPYNLIVTIKDEWATERVIVVPCQMIIFSLKSTRCSSMRWCWYQLYTYLVTHRRCHPQVEMLLHMDTLSWLRAYQYLLFLIRATCVADKQQISIPEHELTIYRTRTLHPNHYTTNTVGPIF